MSTYWPHPSETSRGNDAPRKPVRLDCWECESPLVILDWIEECVLLSSLFQLLLVTLLPPDDPDRWWLLLLHLDWAEKCVRLRICGILLLLCWCSILIDYEKIMSCAVHQWMRIEFSPVFYLPVQLHSFKLFVWMCPEQKQLWHQVVTKAFHHSTSFFADWTFRDWSWWCGRIICSPGANSVTRNCQ